MLRIKENKFISNVDVLLTLHLSIFISVFNQLDAQHLFHNKFYFMSLHVSSGDRGSTVVKVLCYKSEGRWFDPS